MWKRDEIVREVQRLAKEKGGKAPSEKELKLISGIKNYYWHKYWTKITDLQIEAGYPPNTFKKPSLAHEELCEKFVGLVRELRKWPTKAEIDLRNNEDKKFPGSSVFYTRFNKVQGVASNILEYSIKHGYDDVVRICKEVLEKYKNTEELEPGNTPKSVYGTVYLIKHGRYNHYRIGQTENPLRRWNENKIELPEEPTLVWEIKTVDPKGVETYWLNHFKSKKTSNKYGDWFNLTPADVKEFRGWIKIS